MKMDRLADECKLEIAGDRLRCPVCNAIGDGVGKVPEILNDAIVVIACAKITFPHKNDCKCKVLDE